MGRLGKNPPAAQAVSPSVSDINVISQVTNGGAGENRQTQARKDEEVPTSSNMMKKGP